MPGPQLDPLTIPMAPAGPATPRLAPPAAPLGEAAPRSATDARRASLDGRLSAVLRGAARALGGNAAELWLLDDATRRLRRRVAWEATPNVSESGIEPRPLDEADADVAALAGGAVVLESAGDARAWGVHRQTESGVCVPVSSDLSIHGVLWLFGPERAYSDSEIEIAEIVATRLAVELERASLLAADADAGDALAHPEPTSLEAELPTHRLDLETLDVAGWVAPGAGVAFYDWRELEDGRVLAVVGFVLDSPGVGSEASLIAAQTARVASHTLAPTAADAGELLTRVGETLWRTTASGEGVALAVALVGADGRGSVAAAGPVVTLRVGPAKVTSAAHEDTPLGWDLDAEYAAMPVELAADERLLMVVGDPRVTSPSDERALADTFRAPTADGRREMNAAESLKRLRPIGLDSLAAAAIVSRRA